MSLPLAFDIFGLQGFLVLAILGVLLYGERLPEVAAKFGRQLTHLKKAAQAVRSEIESVATDATYGVKQSLDRTVDAVREEATAPKFEPPPAEVSIAATSGAAPVDAH
jgi:Sec-independent protein translocase protein TatA